MPKVKEIAWSSSFKRAYRKRVLGTSDEKLFYEKLQAFVENPFDQRLKCHKLSGNLKSLWAFSVSYDCRVIFQFVSEDRVLLIDIGTHEDVY